MSTFQLIVKGSVDETMNACVGRKITVLFNEPEHWPRWNQTQLFVMSNMRDIQVWFNESSPVDHKYHAGDLLWYNKV